MSKAKLSYQHAECPTCAAARRKVKALERTNLVRFSDVTHALNELKAVLWPKRVAVAPGLIRRPFAAKGGKTT